MKNQLHQFVILLFFMAACSSPTDPPGGETSTIHPENWPETQSGVPIDPDIEARIDALMAEMTDEELVGQTIQADISAIQPEDLLTYRLGSVLNGGNSAPDNDVRSSAEAWLQLADKFYAAAMDTTSGRKAIPILWGTDAVHGHNNIVGATIFPHNIGLGATRNPDLIRRIGAVTAREVLVTGMDWTFAPTLAVVRNDRWGRTYEGYSEDPEIIAQYAGAMVEGLQGNAGAPEFLNEEHVLATAKHFLGDGGTQHGKDQGDNLDTEADFRDLHGAGYPPAIEAGVQTVMASFSSWHGKKMHGSKALLTDVLKERMGFNGFVVGDWNGHGQVAGCENTSCPASINAGLDMFMAPDSWKGLYENTLAQVKSGEIPRQRLEDAVRRILRVKFRLGLFEKPKPSQRPLAGDTAILGAADHLSVARQAVRESLVLLKNQNGILPLATGQTILVAGNGADDIGKQCGGWTYSWQGAGNTKEHFPNGNSIWDGIKQAVEAGGGKAVLSIDGAYEEKPDVALVVFGEDPYAEFMGDRDNVDYLPNDGLGLLNTFKEAGIPTVAVFLSGRPLWVNPELNASDAFVAAWLPGAQGAGIADVILQKSGGGANFDFKGKLSYSWPRTAAQTPLNRHDENYNPLFPYGFGLTYADDGNLAQLSEDPGLDRKAGGKENFFEKGKPVSPWSLKGSTANEQMEVVDAVMEIGGVLNVRSIDRAAQEDAKQARWSGKEPASLEITGNEVDLSRESNGDMAIALQYRVDQKPEGPVIMFVEDAKNGRTELDVTKLFSGDPSNTWTQVDIKLSCFAEAGADMSQLTTVFGLNTEAPFSFSFSGIRLITNEGRAICPE